MFSMNEILDMGLVPIERAAEALGVDPKRLRGYVYRDLLRDPIGDLKTDQVYGWSLRTLADTSSAGVNP